MSVPLFHVDAFTDRPFAGNPAAVCLLTDDRDAGWMQQTAAEMNLSETAFVRREADGFRLRWFTPRVEVDLCGHATLATAHVLWQEQWASAGETLRFHTRSGLLTAVREGPLVWLDFPLTKDEPAPPPPGLAEALGATLGYVGKSRFDYVVEVDSEATLRGLAPNFAALGALPVRGLIVTCRGETPGVDFVSRFFAPAVGVNEDPVTGSAHCCLANFWRQRLHKDEFVAFQASARGGTVQVRVRGDRVLLGGQAVTVARGELLA